VFLDLPLQLLGNFGRFVPDLPDVAVVLAYKPLGPINAAFQSGVIYTPTAGGFATWAWQVAKRLYGDDDSGRVLPSGVYFYKLTAGNKTVTEKAKLVK
jgi:hypothetical protein